MELLGKMVKEIFTYSDIILYWDIQDKKSKDEQYYVYFNGKLINKSHKTHVTIRNIIDKSADVEIYTDDARKVLFYKKSFTMKEKAAFYRCYS